MRFGAGAVVLVLVAMATFLLLGRAEGPGRDVSDAAIPGGGAVPAAAERKPGLPAHGSARTRPKTLEPEEQEAPASEGTARQGPLVGRVILARDGSPVAGARVLVFLEQIERGTAAEARTDEAGRFAFPAGSGSADLVVRAEGRATAVVEAVRFGRKDEVVVALEDGVRVEGEVRDATGAPAAGVAVVVVDEDEAFAPPRVEGDADIYVQRAHEAQDRTTTDAAGRYAIDGLLPGSPRVVIAVRTPRWIGRSDPFVVGGAGEPVRRDVRLPGSGTLLVTVAGTSAAEADLRLGAPGLWIASAPTDAAAGSTRTFEGLTPGRYEVLAWWPGRPERFGWAVVEPDRRTEVVLTAAGGSEATGTVLNPDGDPARGVVVSWGSDPVVRTETDDRGRFVLRDLPTRPATLTAEPGSSPGGRAIAVRREVVPGGPPLEVRLPKAARLTVRIAGSDAHVRGNLELRSADGEFADFGTVWEPGSTLDVRRLDASLRLRFDSTGHAPVFLDVAPLAAGEARAIVLDAPDAGRAVALRIERGQGRPAPGIDVRVLDEGIAGEWTRTDDAGGVILEHLPAKEVLVRIVDPRGAPCVFRVPAGVAGPLTLRLEPTGTLRVRVRERDGTPVPRARVRFSTETETAREAESWFTAADGRQFVTDERGTVTKPAQPRVHRVRVEDAEGKRRAVGDPVVVRAGETTDVEVRLP